jgi:hypothetical protein
VTVHADEFELVWPLHRSHYLNVADQSRERTPMAAVDPTVSPPLIVTPARELAARALLAGTCTHQRVAELLHTSRRSVGRMAEADLTTALGDAQALESARTCLAETASRGSTTEERQAATAWLQEAARDEHQAEPAQVSRRPAARRPKPVHRPSRNGARRNGAATVTTASAEHAPPPFPQVEALRRQQQRILHRSALIDYVLTVEKRGGQTLTMGDALAELLADITDAARTIGTLLQTSAERS